MPSGGTTEPHDDKGPLLPSLWQGRGTVFPPGEPKRCS
jgi:hypothetical protein